MLHAAAAGVPHQIQVQAPQQASAVPSQTAGASALDQAITKLIDDLHAAAGLADDPIDRQELLKCLSVVNGIKANEQKENDAALGGKVSPRQMRKASGGY